VINDNVDDIPIVVFYAPGVVSVFDGEEIENSKDIGTAIVYSPLIHGKS
jgi:hypothetical protein